MGGPIASTTAAHRCRHRLQRQTAIAGEEPFRNRQKIQSFHGCPHAADSAITAAAPNCPVAGGNGIRSFQICKHRSRQCIRVVQPSAENQPKSEQSICRICSS
ncbi:hypothetical protein ACLOJK_033440 [Asimina triloba]